MIRAVYRNGVIYPSEPVPPDWTDGQPVSVESEVQESGDNLAEMDRSEAEWRRAGPLKYGPGERERMRAAMEEADAQAKAYVRRRIESER